MIRLLLSLCIPLTFAQIDIQQLIGLKYLQEGGIHQYLAYKQLQQGLLGGNRQAKLISNQQSSIGGNQQSSLGGNQRSVQGGNQQSSLGGNQQPPIRGNQQSTVGINQQSSLGGNQHSPLGGNQQSKLSGTQQSSISQSQQSAVGGNQQSFLGEVIQSLTGGKQQSSLRGNQQSSIGGNQQSSFTSSQQSSTGGNQQVPIGGNQLSVLGSNRHSLDFTKLLALKRLPRRCRYPAYSGFNSDNPFARFQMYYYNVESGRCETFNYSGRGGNRNRFTTPIQCLRRCACNAPMDPGTCTNSPTTTRYYYNKSFRMCTAFQFNGCDGNDNNFSDYMSCQVSCRGLDMEM